jgi:hypothetical protein
MDGFTERRDADFKLQLVAARAVSIWSRQEPRRIPSVKSLMSDKSIKPNPADLQSNARAWIVAMQQLNRSANDE